MKRYNKKTERKVIAIKEHQYAPEQRLVYQDAIALVRRFRREAQYAKGQFVLEQICRQVKTTPEPQLYLMNIYLDSMNIDDARVLVDQLLKKFPRDISVLTNCAMFFLSIYDTATMFTLIDRAAALDPRNAKIHVLRARAHLSLGNSAGAQACYGAALKLDPRNITAICSGVTSYDNPMEQDQVRAIMDMLGDGQLSDRQRGELLFALAKAFNRSDTDRHFYYLHEGNKIYRDIRSFNAQADRQYAEQIIVTHSQQSLNLPDGASTEKLSPIFIAAMPRSGTTLLEQMLDCHSEIRCIGESAAFANALLQASNSSSGYSLLGEALTPEELPLRVARVALEFQKNYLVRSAGESRLVDKTIANFYHVGDIITVFPRARIIDLRRHPLDIIYSCYKQFFTSGHNYAFDLKHLAERYINHRMLMDYWCEIFPDHILPVSYETLVQEPEPTLRHILDFCGLSWEASCLEFHSNSNVVNTASMEQVRKPLYTSSVYQWEKVKYHLEPAIARLGKLVDYHPVEA